MRKAMIFIVPALLVPAILAGLVYGLFLLWGRDLPSPRKPQEVAPPRNTVCLDRNGAVIGEFFVENRSPVGVEQIPEMMRQAALATEDRRFYRHWGIDLIGITRATLFDLRAGGIRQGASTITQQLARNVFLSHSQTFERKIKEAILAIRLERSFSKEEILELYLNEIYFGEGAYGVEAAAERFFGKSCRDLTLPEAALLAGLPANPAAYSPLRHPEAARRRRDAVLRKMWQAGTIDQETYRRAEEAELVIASPPSAGSRAPYFTEMIRQELMDRFGGDTVYGGGLTVHTTLDLRLQQAAASALESQLADIEAKQILVYHRLRGAGIRGEASRSKDGRTSYLQGALVALEPQSGAIRALVGGRDFEESNFNRAVQARRQPGSAFKPIVMAEAIRLGYKTNSMLLDAPVTYRWGAQVWSPQNFSRDYSGQVTLRYVLQKSINVPSVRLLDAIGPKNVVQFAHEIGLEGQIEPQLSLALGTAEVTPLALTSVYSSFPNHGIRQEPYGIEEVEDPYGNILQAHTPKSFEVMTEQQSYLMVSLMRSVLDRGTAYPARGKYGFTAPAGGKTGTTDDYTDAWFVGYIPRLACGVWVGFDEKKSIGARMTGAAAALPAWCAFMNTAVGIYGSEDFEPPEGIVTVTTCEKTGLLANPGCPRPVADAYLAGTEPTRRCDLHGGSAPIAVEPGQGGEPDLEEAPSPKP
jgi:penicillin-binding protein 1A